MSGLWYVTFGDTITLLLSFFVMLSTFSSYSKEEFTEFAGAWAQMTNYSAFYGGKNDSKVPSPPRAVDWTAAGSEKPTEEEGKSTRNPRHSECLASMADAYHSRRVLHINSSRLFWGQGELLTPAGQLHLKLLANFIKSVPCHVIIGHSSAKHQSDSENLQRPWAVLNYLREAQPEIADRLSLTMAGADLSQQTNGESIMEITIVARRMAP